MAEMKSPNVHAKKNRNDTPRKRKTHIIKVRVTAEEKLRIAYACKELHLTQSSLLGSAFPKPCSSVALVSAQKRRVALHSPLHPGAGIYHFHRRSNMAEMKSPNAHARENRNDTPRKRKTHIIKVRVTAEEKLRIAYACKELHLTQSELVRRVLYGVNVKHTVVVAQGGEDALAALAALSAQCSKVGSNLNQLARHFNSSGKDTEQLRAQILEELSALTNFRLKAEETVGELYGNHQAIIRLRRIGCKKSLPRFFLM